MRHKTTHKGLTEDESIYKYHWLSQILRRYNTLFTRNFIQIKPLHQFSTVQCKFNLTNISFSENLNFQSFKLSEARVVDYVWFNNSEHKF